MVITFLWILCVALILLGLAGTVLPVLPGTVLVWGGIVLGAWIDDFARVGMATVVVGKDGLLQLSTDGNTRTVTEKEAAQAALQWQQSQPGGSAAVIIAAEKTVSYETVVKAMSALQKAGVQRIGLSVKQGS